MDELHIEKLRASAELTLSTGRTVRGRFFLSTTAQRHGGVERIDDVLNACTGFFPFELEAVDDAPVRVVLYSPSHVVLVRLQDAGFDLRADPSYQLARRESASFLLSHGEHIGGAVTIASRNPDARLSDFTRQTAPFLYLETEDGTTLLNLAHVVEMAPVAASLPRLHQEDAA